MNFNRQELINKIEKGQQGKAVYFDVGIDRLDEDNIKLFPSCYTSIGGFPGSGKTAMFHEAYVLKPYANWIELKKKGLTDIELYWLIWSMERPLIETKMKWVARKLFVDTMNTKYPILLDVPFLNGFKASKVTNEVKEKVYATFDYIEEMFSYIEIKSGQVNPTGIYRAVKDYAETVGKIEKTTYTTKDGLTFSQSTYVKNNPNRITIIGIDHLGKLKGETHEGIYLKPESRELIQKISDYCSQDFRDFYGFSPVVVIQFNRGMENTARFGNGTVIPQPSDFKNSSNPYEDSDVVIALFNPYKMGEKSFNGINLKSLVNKNGANRGRFWVTLKNSYGIDDAIYPLRFIGETGYIDVLPKELNDSVLSKLIL